MAMAGSAFSSVAQKFIQGDITIKILKRILERDDAFTELLQIGNRSNLPDNYNATLYSICMLPHFNATSRISVKVDNPLQSWNALLFPVDALCDDGRCKDTRAVKTLLRKRSDEVEDIYHEKEFIACLLHLCQTLPNHIKGILLIYLYHDIVLYVFSEHTKDK